MRAAILLVTVSFGVTGAVANGGEIQYEYSPVGIEGEARDEMLGRITSDIKALCEGITGPEGEELPDLASVGEEISALFNLWWFGDEWTLAEYRESRNQQVSNAVGQDGHQEYFEECVASIRGGALCTLQMELSPWMVNGVTYERARGDRPCSTTSKAGYTPEQVAELEANGATVMDVHFPIKAFAHTKSGEAVECEVRMTITLIWDAEDEQWEAAQITICGYRGDSGLRMTSPIF